MAPVTTADGRRAMDGAVCVDPARLARTCCTLQSATDGSTEFLSCLHFQSEIIGWTAGCSDSSMSAAEAAVLVFPLVRGRQLEYAKNRKKKSYK